jgi:hypothetical protein
VVSTRDESVGRNGVKLDREAIGRLYQGAGE